MNDPMVPAALAHVVKGITALNDFRPRPSPFAAGLHLCRLHFVHGQ